MERDGDFSQPIERDVRLAGLNLLNVASGHVEQFR